MAYILGMVMGINTCKMVWIARSTYTGIIHNKHGTLTSYISAYMCRSYIYFVKERVNRSLRGLDWIRFLSQLQI